MPVVRLDPVLWDAEAILKQLQQAVQAKDTWQDFSTGATGETILEIQAGVAALNNFASESALQESMLLNAKNDSSIYAFTASQGVRIGRKVPATCTVSFTRTDAPPAGPIVSGVSSSLAGGSLPAGTYFYRVTALFAGGESTPSAEVPIATNVLAIPVATSPTTSVVGGALPAATYFYKITALGSAGETLASNEVSVPTGLLSAPVASAPTTSTTGGTLAAATYFYKITALGSAGETLASNEVSVATTGTTSSNTVPWNAVPGAMGYKVYRGTVAGAEGVSFTLGNVTAFEDIGAAGTAGTPPSVNTAVSATNSNTVPWNAVPGAMGYKVYRGTATGAENVSYAPGNVTTFVDTGAAGGAGAPPTQNSAVSATNSNTIPWSAVPSAIGYRVYRGTAAGAESVFYSPGNVTNFIDTGADATPGAPPSLGTQTQSIPAYSQFSAGGIYLFNREAIIFNQGDITVQAQLFEGTIVSRAVQGIGEDFQSWISPEDSFSISDLDVQIAVANSRIPVIQDGLWNYKDPTKDAAQDATTPKGHLLLRFGNDLFGYKPLVSDIVNISYATTSGFNGNNSAFTGTRFTFSTVQCQAVTGLAGGYDEKPASLYRTTTPNLWGAHDTAVSGPQYHAIACQYPGVRDVKFFAQRELSVRDPKFMNLFKVVILSDQSGDPTFAFQQKLDFKTWFTNRSMYSGELFFEDPHPQPTVVNVDVFIRNTADPASIQASCKAAIKALFQPRFGYLQTNIYHSDIDAACYAVDDAVKFVRIRAPVDDIIVGTNPPANVAVQAIPGTGSLPPGNYNYAVTTLNALGESAISSYPSANLTVQGSVMISWDQAPNSTGYKIYGRQSAGVGLLATIGSTTFSYLDDATAAPGTPPQLVDTSGIWYANLVSVNVNVDFSDRVPFNQR